MLFVYSSLPKAPVRNALVLASAVSESESARDMAGCSKRDATAADDPTTSLRLDNSALCAHDFSEPQPPHDSPKSVEENAPTNNNDDESRPRTKITIGRTDKLDIRGCRRMVMTEMLKVVAF